MANVAVSPNGSDTKASTDADTSQLQQEETQWKARQAIAEAQKATVAALLPTSDLKPLEGQVTVGEKVGLIGDLIAHSLLGKAAKTIAEQVNEHITDTSTVLVIEDRLLAGTDWPFALISRELDHQERIISHTSETLRRRNRPKAAVGETLLALPIIASLPTIVGAAAAVVGMFRSDYSIANRDVTVGTTPLVAAMVRELREILKHPAVMV